MCAVSRHRYAYKKDAKRGSVAVCVPACVRGWVGGKVCGWVRVGWDLVLMGACACL